MFFGEDRKKAVMTLMSKRSAKGEKLSGPTPMKNEVVKTEEGELDGRHLAAQDAVAAINEKSPAKLMQALSNFIDIHGSPASSSEGDAGGKS